MDIIITFFLILIPSIAIGHMIGKNNDDSTVAITEIIPIINMGIIICLYFVGLMLGLNTAIIVVDSLLLVISVWGGINSYKKKIKITQIIKAAFPVALIYVFFSVTNRGMLAGHSTDDFTHWIYIVKEMVRLNDFGTNANADAWFASYPPGISLFQYFFEKMHIACGNTFSEWRSFLSYHFFTISMFLPFINKKDSCGLVLIKSIIFCLLPTCFYQIYSGLQIEPIIGVMVGCVFFRIIAERDKKNISYDIYVILTCSVLTLIKDSGILFSLFVFVAYVYDLWNRYSRNQISNKFKWWMSACIIIAIMIPKFLWNVELGRRGVSSAFSQTVDFKILLNAFIGEGGTYREAVWHDFIIAIFSRSPNVYNTWSLDETVNANWFTISYFTLLVIFTVVSFGVLNYANRHTKADSNRMQSSIVVLFWIMSVVYILGIGTAYISNFSEAEAKNLASFTRYIQVIYLAAFVLVIMLLIRMVEINGINLKLKMMTILCAILIIAPKHYFVDFIARDIVSETQERRSHYNNLIYLINHECKDDDKVALINQERWEYPYVLLRYSIRPLQLDNIEEYWGAWYLDEAFFCGKSKDDIWNLMDSYDYIAIYNIDDNLINCLKEFISDENDISEDSLYKVNHFDNNLEKVR